LLLFASGIVPSLRIGDADFKSSALTWETVLVIGFVAGFPWNGLSPISWKRRTQSNGANTTGAAAASAG
jgi:hypothetical protein